MLTKRDTIAALTGTVGDYFFSKLQFLSTQKQLRDQPKLRFEAKYSALRLVNLINMDAMSQSQIVLQVVSTPAVNMASGSKEKHPKIRGMKNKLFFKETQRLAEQLLAVSGEDWVAAVASYASENELHLQIFPERNILHRKIMAKHASQIGLFLQGLVKKYLEFYTSELGMSATLLFAFISFVGKTLNGETKLSDVWLSIIDGEDKETARHIGNMYGLALMYRVDKFIEKENASRTGKEEVCHSVELDDYTSVSLMPRNTLTSTNKRKCRGFKFNPSLAAKGDKKAVSVAHTTSLINITRRKSKRRRIPSTLGARRHSSAARSNVSPGCVISAESVTLFSPDVSAGSLSCMSPGISTSVNSASSSPPVSASINSVSPDNSADSASTSVQFLSAIPVSHTPPSDSSMVSSTTIDLGNDVLSCVSTPSLSLPKQISSKVEASSTSIALPSPNISTRLKTPPVHRTRAQEDTTMTPQTSMETNTSRVTRSATKYITTTAQRSSRRRITSPDPIPSRRNITKASSRRDTTSKFNATTRLKKRKNIAAPSKYKILSTRDISTERAPSVQRKASTRQNSLTPAVNSTRSGRVPKKKSVLDL